ncbi:hypothetical protein EYC80_007555 [Monilinia laxa]|uniref:Uncharacterized protein n=1 Tax=Monilinia laxa TaxID=61186 RepID=A0A5N6JWA2_MONLA|nr:hypothetical protein EYC80_007555 [Monilinia laxa]
MKEWARSYHGNSEAWYAIAIEAHLCTVLNNIQSLKEEKLFVRIIIPCTNVTASNIVFVWLAWPRSEENAPSDDSDKKNAKCEIYPIPLSDHPEVLIAVWSKTVNRRNWYLKNDIDALQAPSKPTPRPLQIQNNYTTISSWSMGIIKQVINEN